jgi:acyl-CoA reductase-like NAD-dependent aldehyde dehydrogenase
VAPDYVYVDASVKDEFLKHLTDYFKEFVPEGAKTPDLPKIVNKKTF